MRRMIIVNGLIILAVLALIGIGGYLFYNNYYFYSTDDAQISGNIVNITPTASGTLSAINATVGQQVTAGQVIGTINATSPATGATTTVNLTAPITGIILLVPAVAGQTVLPGLTLAEETDLSTVNVIAYVDEGALNNISINQSVDIHVDAYTSTSFTGHVSQIVDAAASEFSLLPTQDNASGNFTKVSQRIPVIITIDGNAGKTLLPGMSAEVVIHLH